MQSKRIALVTGANQGVGLRVAKELVANGVTVLAGSRNFERGEAATKEIGPGAIALQLDVTDRVSIATAAAGIRNEFGRLCRAFGDSRTLLDMIMLRLTCGDENLDIIRWARRETPLPDQHRVCELLRLIDVNSHRLRCFFHDD